MIKIKQVRSKIGLPKKQKATLQALGVKKLHKVVEVSDSPQVRGMIAKVEHVLEILG